MDPSTLTVMPQDDGTFCVGTKLPDGSVQPYSTPADPADPSADPGTTAPPGCFATEVEATAFLAGLQAGLASEPEEPGEPAEPADPGAAPADPKAKAASVVAAPGDPVPTTDPGAAPTDDMAMEDGDGSTVTIQLDQGAAVMLANLISAIAEALGTPVDDGTVDPEDAIGDGVQPPSQHGIIAALRALQAAAKPVGVTLAKNMPIAPRDTPWDGQAAANRLLDDATAASGKINPSKAGKGFAWVNEDGTRAVDYSLPIADLVDGKLRVVPAGVIAVAAAIHKGAANLGIDESGAEQVKKILDGYYAEMQKSFKDPSMIAPWAALPPPGVPVPDKAEAGDSAPSDKAPDAPDPERAKAVAASLGIPESVILRPFTTRELDDLVVWLKGVDPKSVVASVAAPAHPPKSWFEYPQFDRPTPLTVTADGRVFGHIAEWDRCHIGLPGCQKPPRSLAAYAYFNRRQLVTAEGETIAVGRLTLGTGHATLDLSPRATVDHYDNTGTVAAVVRAGEDEFGPWIAGAVRPDLDDISRWELEMADVSGDWREIVVGGRRNLELVAALGVNVPGFPITPPALAASASNDRAVAAVGLGAITHEAQRTEGFGRIAQHLLASIGQDRASRARALRERVAI